MRVAAVRRWSLRPDQLFTHRRRTHLNGRGGYPFGNDQRGACDKEIANAGRGLFAAQIAQVYHFNEQPSVFVTAADADQRGGVMERDLDNTAHRGKTIGGPALRRWFCLGPRVFLGRSIVMRALQQVKRILCQAHRV